MNDSTEPCLTHYLTDFRSCCRRDQHYADCSTDGCTGCAPRNARFGFLCAPCYGRVEDALPVWRHLQDALAGINRAVQHDNRKQGKPGASVPIPPIPLDFEEIRSYHSTFTGTVERWVASEDGATDALRFARAVNNAERAHPTIEHPRKLQRTRCPDCGQLTFTWHPPTIPGSPIRVKCRNDACGREVTRVQSIDDIAHIEALPR